MRSAIYHPARNGAALAVVVQVLLAGTPAFASAPTIAEAWVVVDGPEDLPAVQSVGLTLDEAHRALPDGRWEQRILARPAALEALTERGFTWRLERPDHRRGAPLAASAYRPPDVGDGVLADLASQAPRGGLVVLGESEEGRPITALWIGQPPEAGAPTWRVLGAHHGDEWSSFEVALEVAKALVEGDGTDPATTALLDEATVWVAPYVNPDGVVAGSRYNSNGVDLNRNYDFEWSPYEWGSGDRPFSESETRAIRSLAAWDPPLASVSLHGGAENVGYVWNWSHDPTPEEPILEDLAVAYADAVDMPSFYATNGADWYVTRGDTNDWSYGRYGGMDFTVEISSDKVPPTEDLPAYVTAHRRAIQAFLSTAPTLSGHVTDAVTGEPVEAFLTLDRAGVDPIPMATHPGGAFHRLAGPGTATLEAWAPGYETASTTVQIGTTGALDLTVALQPLPLGQGTPSPRVVAGVTEITLPGGPAVGVARLVRTAFADVSLPITQGAFRVDPDEVAPGPWSIVLPDGTAWPRALFVADPGPAQLDSVIREASWTVSGSGFAVGSRAWALVGERRTPVPLPVLSESASSIVLDAGAIDGNADLVVVSNGTWLGTFGAADAPDTGAPDDTGRDTAGDTGGDLPPELVRGSCSCATGADPAGLGILALLALLARRRTT